MQEEVVPVEYRQVVAVHCCGRGKTETAAEESGSDSMQRTCSMTATVHLLYSLR